MSKMHLHGDLNKEVSTTLPQGLSIKKNRDNKTLVCKLQKFLYRLKQTSRMWFTKLNEALTHLGFHQSRSDYALFIRTTNSDTTIVLDYVDDLCITSSQLTTNNELKQKLSTFFNIKDLGTLKYFLGLQFTRTSKGLYIGQRKYALDLLDYINQLNSKPKKSPSTTSPYIGTNAPHRDKELDDPLNIEHL